MTFASQDVKLLKFEEIHNNNKDKKSIFMNSRKRSRTLTYT